MLAGAKAMDVWMARSQVQPELASGIKSIPLAGIMLIQQPGRLTVVTFALRPLARSHMVAVPARKKTVWADAEGQVAGPCVPSVAFAQEGLELREGGVALVALCLHVGVLGRAGEGFGAGIVGVGGSQRACETEAHASQQLWVGLNLLLEELASALQIADGIFESLHLEQGQASFAQRIGDDSRRIVGWNVAATLKADILPLADALAAGGLRVLEVTLRSEHGLEAIRRLRAERPELCVGAGTVLDEQMLEAATAAGAQFIVTPGSTRELLLAALDNPLPLLPGVSSASELMVGYALGYRRFKLFPAELCGGVAALKALSGPFGGVRFCPTGGVNPDNLQRYMEQPNVMCVGGTWMFQREWVENGDWGAEPISSAKCRSTIRYQSSRCLGSSAIRKMGVRTGATPFPTFSTIPSGSAATSGAIPYSQL